MKIYVLCLLFLVGCSLPTEQPSKYQRHVDSPPLIEGEFCFISPNAGTIIPTFIWAGGQWVLADYDIEWTQSGYEGTHVEFTLHASSGDTVVATNVPTENLLYTFPLIAGWYGEAYLTAEILETNEIFQSETFEIVDRQ